MDVRTLRDSIAPTFHAILQASEHAAIKELNPFTEISDEMIAALIGIDMGQVNMIFNALCNGGDTALVTKGLIPVMVNYMEACKLERSKTFTLTVTQADDSEGLQIAEDNLVIDQISMRRNITNSLEAKRGTYASHIAELEILSNEIANNVMKLHELDNTDFDTAKRIQEVLEYAKESSFYTYIGNTQINYERNKLESMAFVTDEVVVRHSVPSVDVNDSYNFGKFMVLIPIGELSNHNFKAIRCVPIFNNMYSEFNSHPHVGPKFKVCFGKEHEQALVAYRECRLTDVLEKIMQVLSYYYDDNPYRCITTYKGKRDFPNVMDTDAVMGADQINRLPYLYNDTSASRGRVFMNKYKKTNRLNAVHQGVVTLLGVSDEEPILEIPDCIKEQFSAKTDAPIEEFTPPWVKLQEVPEFKALEEYVQSLGNEM